MKFTSRMAVPSWRQASLRGDRSPPPHSPQQPSSLPSHIKKKTSGSFSLATLREMLSYVSHRDGARRGPFTAGPIFSNARPDLRIALGGGLVKKCRTRTHTTSIPSCSKKFVLHETRTQQRTACAGGAESIKMCTRGWPCPSSASSGPERPARRPHARPPHAHHPTSPPPSSLHALLCIG